MQFCALSVAKRFCAMICRLSKLKMETWGYLPCRTCSARAARHGWSCTDRSLQYGQELLYSSFFLLREFALAAEQPRIQLGSQQRILKTLHGPIQYGDDHFHIHVFAQFAAIQAKAHKQYSPVRILRNQKAVNLASLMHISPIIHDKCDEVRDPVLVQKMLGTR